MKAWAEPVVALCRSMLHLHRSPGTDPERKEECSKVSHIKSCAMKVH